MATVIGVDSSVAKRCTCKNCASIIEYLPIDVAKTYSTDYTGGRDYYSYIKCPKCANSIMVR